MSRLIDINDLQGCAIIRPTTHEEMEHIKACKNLINHDDIPTAYDVDKVVEQLEREIELRVAHYPLHGTYIKKNRAIEIVKAGGIDETN